MDKNVKPIITDPELLQEWCIEIDTKKENKLLQEIVLALKNTMRANDLISLSAPQIGYNRRVFCLKFGKNDIRTFVNPVIENNTAFQFARDNCTSIPDKRFIIPRFANISVIYTTPLSKIESVKLSGVAAFRFQHCLDHLNGMLVSDIGLEIDDQFDNASEDEKAEVLKMYADALDVAQHKLEEEIHQDTELSDIVDASRFIASVKSGETMIDKIEDEKSTN